MMHPTSWFRLTWLLTCVAFCLSIPAYSQGLPQSVATAQFDPSDVYFQGYLATRSAERLEAAGDHIAAADKYRKAGELFSTVSKYYPQWNPAMVSRRHEKNSKALALAENKAKQQLQKQQSVVAELEGGINKTIKPLEIPKGPEVLKVDPVAKRRLQMAQQEVERLRGLLAKQEQQNAELAANVRQLDRDAANQQLTMKEQSARALAAAQEEIRRLRAMAAIQSHDQLEAERLKKLLAAESARVKQLELEVRSINSDSETALQQLQEKATKSLAEANAEIRRLRRISSMEQSKAESEIKRLRQLTGEMERESEQKIAQLQTLADAAKNHAEQEVERMEKLTGKARKLAQAEVNRLKDVAEKAQADARQEIEQLQQLTTQTQSESRAEIERLRELANRNRKEADAKANELDLARAQNIKLTNAYNNNRALLESKLQAAQNSVRELTEKLAKAPMESEVEELNHKIHRLEQERNAMAITLQESRNGYAGAMDHIDALEQELIKARQESTNLHRDLAAERDAANAVVGGQRRQLEALQRQLDQKANALAMAQDEIGRLKLQLEESNAALTEIREERNALLLERDQMAALLKLNEDGRIQDLVEQNMGLAKQLREANEKIDRMFRDGNADKDAITEALRDLAIAKSQINRLHQERRDQEQRIEELEQRLKQEEMALAKGETAADAQEVALLRDIIRRQLRMQQRRRQARELLINAVKDLGNQDEQIAEAVELIQAQEIALTPEEQKLVANQQVDGEFISPFARDRKQVQAATASLHKDISVFERTARKAFLAGRLRPTRELYEMVLEAHPGHTPTLCKLGVVHLKLNEPDHAVESFRKATELDPGNSYALRMLGYSLMKNQQFEDAEIAARRSVEIQPNDAKTHMLLATLCYRLGKSGEAESHFKGAINADPLPSEPYYNLALICSASGRIDQARQYYRQALERGALPDPKLEEAIATQ